MARRVIVTPDQVNGGEHIVVHDDAGMGTDVLRRKARYTDSEVTKFEGHARMMRQQPARGGREGTVNSKWSG